MLTLYVKNGCPYSAVALKKVDDLGLTINEKNTATDGVIEEMIGLGGKKQTPLLHDPERGVIMYESDAIAKYLEEHYGNGEAASDEESGRPVTLHRVDDSNVCEACE